MIMPLMMMSSRNKKGDKVKREKKNKNKNYMKKKKKKEKHRRKRSRSETHTKQKRTRLTHQKRSCIITLILKRKIATDKRSKNNDNKLVTSCKN